MGNFGIVCLLNLNAEKIKKNKKNKAIGLTWGAGLWIGGGGWGLWGILGRF